MKKKYVTIILFSIYIILLIWILLLKLSFSLQDMDKIRGINFVPFTESVISNGKIDIDEIVNNALIFVPFGIYLSMLIPKWRAIKIELTIVGFSVVIEVLQYIFAVGATDITDVIMNGMGAGVGIVIYNVGVKIFKEKANEVFNILALIGTLSFIFLLYLIL